RALDLAVGLDAIELLDQLPQRPPREHISLLGIVERDVADLAVFFKRDDGPFHDLLSLPQNTILLIPSPTRERGRLTSGSSLAHASGYETNRGNPILPFQIQISLVQSPPGNRISCARAGPP